jgi:hypothetical protein
MPVRHHFTLWMQEVCLVSTYVCLSCASVSRLLQSFRRWVLRGAGGVWFVYVQKTCRKVRQEVRQAVYACRVPAFRGCRHALKLAY